MTKEDAVTLYNSGWWKDLPARDVVQLQLYEERLIMPFAEFQEAVSKALDRPVWTHEFGKPESLRAEFEGRRPAPNGPVESLRDVLGK